MYTKSLILAGAIAVQAGGILMVRQPDVRALALLAKGNGTTTSLAGTVPTWGSEEGWSTALWEVHSGDAGVLSAGQSLSTQTDSTSKREPTMDVEPTGYVAVEEEDATPARSAKVEAGGPDFSWLSRVDGVLALGMVLVTTAAIFTAAG